MPGNQQLPAKARTDSSNLVEDERPSPNVMRVRKRNACGKERSAQAADSCRSMLDGLQAYGRHQSLHARKA